MEISYVQLVSTVKQRVSMGQIRVRVLIAGHCLQNCLTIRAAVSHAAVWG